MQAYAHLASSAASKRVIAGISSTITRSCYRTPRGKAHAAPLSAQEPPPKGQKRISKQERRVKIEEFVEKYRASNEGKFPTITNIRQHVGGGHYTVRDILQELEYNHANPPLDNAKARLQGTADFAEQSGPKDEPKVAQLEGIVEFAEQPGPKDEPKVSQLQGTAEFVEQSGSEDESKAAQLQGTAEFAEQSGPKDEPKVAQVQGTAELAEHSRPKDVDNAIILQKDATTSSEIMEKTETWRSVDSSHYNVEIEASKQDVNTSETLKCSNGLTLSDQTASDEMKAPMSEPFISLGVEAKSDCGNQKVETEADKLDLNNTENSLNARKQTVSDQSRSGKVIKANVLDREHDPTHKLEESTNTGLLGSLKSFAYGIMNFWNKL